MSSKTEEMEGDFVVEMYESEYRQIQAWVDKHQNLETGGDLFGLWADDHTAVVQLVLGPGEHCTRTPASFYQDVEYLERVGNKLTNEQGLCHIGEWHSHHRLGLKEPSEGDERTVWTHMERYGINRFFLFIATIEGGCSHKRKARYSSPYDVKVRCFPFQINSGKRIPVLQGEIKFKFIPDNVQESPFRINLAKVLENGAESQNLKEEMKKFEINSRDYEETTRKENQISSKNGKDNYTSPQNKKRQDKKSRREKRKTNQKSKTSEDQEQTRKTNEDIETQAKGNDIDSCDDQDHSANTAQVGPEISAQNQVREIKVQNANQSRQNKAKRKSGRKKKQNKVV